MCQAFAAEQRIFSSMEKDARAEGFKAFHEGKSLDDAPISSFDFPDQWKLGFYIAQGNKELF